MAFRADILAGRAVILVSIQDTVDKQLRSIRTKMFNFSNAINKMGQDLTLFGAAGTLAGFLPVKEFVDFQDAMLFVETKLQTTQAKMESLEKVVRSLGRSTSFTSKEVAEAAAVLAQAGLAPEEVEAALLPSLDLARGARLQINDAARILANTIASFGLSFKDADEIASKLIVAARLGPLDVVDIGESLKESIATFRMLDVNMTDLVGSIVQLSNVSIRGTKAGTSLNTAFANLASKGPELRALGIFIEEKDLGNIKVVFTKIKEGISGLSKFKQVEALQSLFNIRGQRGIGGVTIQSLDDLKSVLDQIDRATTEARTSAEKLDSKLGGVYRRGLSAFQEALISIGSTTEGPLSGFGEGLAKVFNNISLLAEQNPKFVQTLLLIPPVALAAGLGLLGLSVVLSRLGLLISPIIMLNNALFTSLYKLASLNLAGVGKGLAIISTPGRGFLQKIAAENAAVLKAQTAYTNLVNKALPLSKKAAAAQAGATTKAFRNVLAAENARSFLTRPRSLSIPQGSTLINGIVGGLGAADKGISSLFSNAKKIAPTRAAYFSLARVLGNVAEKAADVKGNYFNLARIMGNVAEDIQKSLKTGYFRLAFSLGNIAENATKVKGAYFGVARIMGNVAEIFSRGFKGSSIKGFEFGIQGILKTFRILLTGFKGFFSILGGIRRFVFSASGILTIIEFLIIAGPKIRPIAAILDGLGRGFRGMFSAFREGGAGVISGMKLLFSGIKELATGDTALGLATIKDAFSGIADIISNTLTAAWQRFLVETKRGMEFLKASFAAIMGIGKAVGNTIGSVAGTLFNDRTANSEEPFEYEDTAINILKEISFGIVHFIEGIGIQLITIADILNRIFSMVSRGFFTLASIFGSSEQEASARSVLSLEDQAIVDQQKVLALLELRRVRLISTGRNKPSEIDAVNENIRITKANLALANGVNPEDFLQNQLDDYRISMDKVRTSMTDGFGAIKLTLDEANKNLESALNKMDFKRFKSIYIDETLRMLQDFRKQWMEGVAPRVIDIPVKGVELDDIQAALQQAGTIIKSVLGTSSQVSGQTLQVLPNKIEQEHLDVAKDMRDDVAIIRQMGPARFA